MCHPRQHASEAARRAAAGFGGSLLAMVSALLRGFLVGALLAGAAGLAPRPRPSARRSAPTARACSAGGSDASDAFDGVDNFEDFDSLGSLDSIDRLDGDAPVPPGAAPLEGPPLVGGELYEGLPEPGAPANPDWSREGIVFDGSYMPQSSVEKKERAGRELLLELEQYAGRRSRAEAEAAMSLDGASGNAQDVSAKEPCFVVGVDMKSIEHGFDPEGFTMKESLSELAELARTAGMTVVGAMSQSLNEPNPRSYIGSGKVREVRSAMRSCGCKTVVLDEELSPGQQRNLEAAFGGEEAGIKVLDRTALILDIFSQHARTREGILQVELALASYRLPRLTRLWTHLERQSGGGGKSGAVGLRGPGERQIEVDRRLLRDRINDLKKQLEGIRTTRATQRKKRRREGVPVVALVGYTNAGKSTVLNHLTTAGVLSEDMLFATLDPTTRRVRLPALKVHPDVLFTDTVGFIQKLPTQLVAAFRATLEEVTEADVIVHVCDASNPSWQKQSRAVAQTLRALGVLDEEGRSRGTPIVTLYNKMDRVQDPSPFVRGVQERPLTVTASAQTGDGMLQFVLSIEEALRTLLRPVEALVPYEKGELLNEMHERGVCDDLSYKDEGARVVGRAPLDLARRLEAYSLLGEDQADEAGDAEEDWKQLAKGRHAYMEHRERRAR